MNNIGWHLRKYSDGSKVAAGSFNGDISMETANRFVKVYLDVEILPSGHAVFIDKKTREKVSLYFTIDASKTDKGKEALKEYRQKQQKEWQKEEKRRERIEDVLNAYSTDELESMLAITKC